MAVVVRRGIRSRSMAMRFLSFSLVFFTTSIPFGTHMVLSPILGEVVLPMMV